MRHTPLYKTHIELGAQMVEFAGFAMPVRYASGEKAEHLAVRSAAGLFDVSHMGEIFLTGEKACDAADVLFTNDLRNAEIGQALYGVMLNEKAGIVDDVVAYKFSREKILLCVNASNLEKDHQWVLKIVSDNFSKTEVQVTNASDDYAQLALQGPNAAAILRNFTQIELETIKKFYFLETSLTTGSGPVPVILAKTGYTGEDGFEIFGAQKDVESLWNELLRVGAAYGLLPCGLSARDTLRLEAGMCLYGNDIDEDTTPLEAGLSWVVKWDKDVPFFGRAELFKKKEMGLGRKLVGLKLSDRNIARPGYEIFDENGNSIGSVTSGTLSPFLNVPIAMAYVKKPFADTGTSVYVEIRRNKAKATVTKLPFYKKAKVES